MNWEKIFTDPLTLFLGGLAIIVVVLIVCITAYSIVALKYQCRHQWEKDGDVYTVCGRTFDEGLNRERGYTNRYQKLRCAVCGGIKTEKLP